jgi:predicted  nucleic acid-binding Zn-ribbon protein
MSAALGLFRLQQVDRQLDQARARHDEIRAILENDAELHDMLERTAVAGNEKDQSRRNLADAELQVQNQQTKIQQAESSLYGGSVKNPKELQDLQNDVAALKRHLATLEERQLEAMVRSESAESVMTALKAEGEILNARLGDEHRQLFEEQGTLAKTMQRLQAERQAVVGALAKQALEIYENLRQQRRGLAVAEVHENTCSACGTTLTAALRQNARSTSVMSYCPTCSRILYAD